MVRPGSRAASLARLLGAAGLRADTVERRTPRLEDLAGAWDLSMGGVLIELDEELYFNRYRKITFERPWTASLPWAPAYLQTCESREAECLRAAT